MATSKEYKDFILEQLRLVDNLECKPMMGEFLLYSNGKLFGGIYDNRLLIKVTPNNHIFNLQKEIPYENAKPMYAISDVDDIQNLNIIISFTCNNLS